MVSTLGRKTTPWWNSAQARFWGNARRARLVRQSAPREGVAVTLKRLSLARSLFAIFTLAVVAGPSGTPLAAPPVSGEASKVDRHLIAWTGKAGPAWAEYDKLVAEDKLVAAANLAEAKLSEFKGGKNSEEWTRALLRLASRRYVEQALPAVRRLREEAWPQDVLGFTATSLVYAGLLERYVNDHRWELGRREPIEGPPGDALQAWGRARFQQEIWRTYQGLWDMREQLGQLKQSALAEYLVPNEYPPEIRPTLRDAVTYLMVDALSEKGWLPFDRDGNDSDIEKEVGRLTAGGPLPGVAIADTTVSAVGKIAYALDDLELFHNRRGETEAAAAARQTRAEEIFAVTTSDAAQVRLRHHLEKVVGRIEGKPWWSMGMAALADMAMEGIEPDHLIRAREWAIRGETAFPQSLGGKRCRSIRDEIDNPTFDLEAMSSDGPKQRSLGVRYKNLRKLNLRAFPLDVEGRLKAGKSIARPTQHEIEAMLSGQQPVFAWSIDLAETRDHELHRTFVAPPMERFGVYLVAASIRDDFANAGNQVKTVIMSISDLVLVTGRERAGFRVDVFSARSGRPLPDVEVCAYDADRKTGPWVRQRTNELGTTVLTVSGKERDFSVLARHGADVAIQQDNWWSRSDQENSATRAMVYTDRSSYRPQQEVKLKVVAYRGRRGAGDFRIVPRTSIKLTLFDAFHNKVDEQTLVTNLHGSAAGSFRLPPDRPLGRWSIGTSLQGEAWISVEEYHRPTFETRLLDPVAPLRLGQPVVWRGEARYYFGQPVSLGKVHWHVTRTMIPKLPVRWRGQRTGRLWYKKFANEWGEPTVTSGTSAIGADGGFEIRVQPTIEVGLPKGAIEDVVTYTVDVEVTNEGGETNRTRRTFRVGRVAVEAKMVAETRFLREGQPGQIRIVRTSLDGAPAPGKGEYRIVQVKQPETASLPSDQPNTDEPSTAYDLPDDHVRARWQGSEVEADSWLGKFPDGADRTSGQVVHDQNGEAVLALPALAAGAWRIKYATTDSSGARYETSQELIVGGPRTSLALPAYLQIEKGSVNVGESARVLVGSGLPNQALVLDRLRDGDLVSRTVLEAGRGATLIEIPITAKDRGGFSLALTVIRDHQRMHLAERVSVPWDNEQLNVDFATFRNQLQPGSSETWTVKVTGPAGRPTPIAAAEVLAYMYDRSLDAFSAHEPFDPTHLFPRHDYQTVRDSNLGEAFGWPLWRASPGIPSSGWEPPSGDRLKLMLDLDLKADVARKARPGSVAAFAGVNGKMKAMAEGLRGGQFDLRRSANVSADKSERSDLYAPPPSDEAKSPSAPRSDFSESAFFLPHLLTGADGTVSFQFQVPDSVTAWTAWAHALTKDFKFGSIHRDTSTTRELMVRPYMPRFLREGDRAVLKVVVNNVSTHELNGSVSIDIVDADSGRSVREAFQLQARDADDRAFSVPAGGSATLAFTVTAPAKLGEASIKVTARAGDFSVGELRPLPILPGRMHLMQSRLTVLKNPSRRALALDDLGRNDDVTRALEQIVVTVDAQLFSAALSALPYLLQYPHECTEQTLNRVLSSGILASLYGRSPAIRRMVKPMANRKTQFKAWGEADANRRIAVQETPWLATAKGGGSALEGDLVPLLDAGVVKANRATSLAKLARAQLPNGAFPWFSGGPPSSEMTLYLLAGFAKAAEFGVEVPKGMAASASRYLHAVYLDDYARDMKKDRCWHAVTLLGYVLSGFPDPSWYGKVFTHAEREAMLEFSFRHWREHSPYLKGLLALTLKRMGREADARLVWESVLDRAHTEADLGTFWPAEDNDWLWYNDPIESQAAAIRTTMEISPQSDKLDGMVQWLLLGKQQTHWKSTRATAEAIYALAGYLKAKAQLGGRQRISVSAGDRHEVFDFAPDQLRPGKHLVIPAADLATPAAPVVVESHAPGLAVVSATWHYATDALPAGARGDLVAVSREYFVVDRSGKLLPLAAGAKPQLGDELDVRLILHSKVPLDYVHVFDPRAAGCEPASSLSRHRFAGDLAWYEEVRDSGTNFFLEHLPRGEHVLHYRLRASMTGTFKVAPATAQPLYAPQHTAFSAGNELEILDGHNVAATRL
jgi:alpha-2-macroglobulin